DWSSDVCSSDLSSAAGTDARDTGIPRVRMADSGAPGNDFPMKEAMRIVDLAMLRVPEAARLLVDSYAEHWPQAWPSYEDAVRRVEVALAGDGVNRIALDAADELVGWSG